MILLTQLKLKSPALAAFGKILIILYMKEITKLTLLHETTTQKW